MDRRTVLTWSGATLAAVAGCLDRGPPDAVTVEMADESTFAPSSVTVGVGGTVRWVNESEVGHTVTAYGDELPDGAGYFASGGFDSERAAWNDMREGIVAPGEEYEHTFEVAGRYGYYCIPHEGSGMTGEVRVE